MSVALGMHDDGRLFRRLLGAHLALALGLGAVLSSVEIGPAARSRDDEPHRVSFHVAPERDVHPTPATPAPAAADPPPAVPVLTPETVLDQAVDLAEPGAAEPPAYPSPLESAPETPPARRVYGVRRVLSRGLGAGAGDAGALVVRRGNTLDGRADTLAATAADLAGRLVPLSTVEQAPVPVHRVKPEYSAALREHRVSGTVTARLLVDRDGGVRSVEILEDIGYDSRDLARDAFAQFRFRPALRRGEPVAVWIVHKIRFEFRE